MKFNVTPEGRPTGCEGLDEAWLNGHSVFTGKVTCPKEDYAPEGIPLHQLVESMADDQQLFMEVYIAAHVVDDRTNLVTVTVRPNLEVRWFGRTSRYGRPNHHRTKSLHLSSFLRFFGGFHRIFLKFW